MENGQKIEAPTEADIDAIARALLHAQGVAADVLGSPMDGTRQDLELIQRLFDSHTIERESTYTLHALGLALGRAFIHDTKDSIGGWWRISTDAMPPFGTGIPAYFPFQ
jgi:hypothetical protein